MQQDSDDIDIFNTNKTWVDGHGDEFAINSSWTDTINISSTPLSTTLTWPNTSPSYSYNDITMGSFNPSNKISINGPDADIKINGESVVGMLKEIRDRLNILQVSEEMEQEWDELRVLREQYETKLAECRAKSEAWAALKQAG
jgi:hypothetical protein